jgi:hypothetical protein
MAHIYLHKANDDLVSHCKCKNTDALMSSPGQMDCPWCGCGWLFICRQCRMAFTFAEGIEVDESWEDTGECVILAQYNRKPETGEVEAWIGFMKILLKGVQPGEKYVYLDGYVIPANAEGITIEGWHSYHDLDYVPQVAARSNQEICDRLLCSRQYWESNRVEREDE